MSNVINGNQLTKSQRDAQGTKALSDFAKYMSPRESKLKVFAGTRVDASAMIKLAIFQVSQDPKLLACTPASIYTALVIAAQLGLEPAGIRGEGYLIPFAGECKFMPGYKGLVKLAISSGLVEDISADVVFYGDFFKVIKGTSPRIDHEPLTGRVVGNGEADPDIVAAYAIAKLKSGALKSEVLERWQLDKIRAVSKTSSSADSPWHLWPDEMSRKSAVRRLGKYLPAGRDYYRALALDTAIETGNVSNEALGAIIDLPPEAAIETTQADEAAAAKDANPAQGGRITQVAASKGA